MPISQNTTLRPQTVHTFTSGLPLVFPNGKAELIGTNTEMLYEECC